MSTTSSITSIDVPVNNLQVALQISPFLQEGQTNNLKISKKQIILPNIPNSPVFTFSHVFETGTQPAHKNDLNDKIPKSTLDQLVQGLDTSLGFYGTPNAIFNVRIIQSLSELFCMGMKDYTIHIKFTQYSHNNDLGKDLISRNENSNSHSEYRVEDIDTAVKYYKYGLDLYKRDTLAIFSVILKQKNARISRFNIFDLSSCPPGILNLFTDLCYDHYMRTSSIETKTSSASALKSTVQKSSFLYILGCINPTDDSTEIESVARYLSNIYDKTLGTGPSTQQGGKDRNARQSASNPAGGYSYVAGRVSLNTTTSSTTAASDNDKSSYPRNISMFSSLSNATHLTATDPITEEKERILIADLNRQIEELQNQITVTRERNTHVERELQETHHSKRAEIEVKNRLFAIQDKQQELIGQLENKLQQMDRLNDDLCNRLVGSDPLKEPEDDEIERLKKDVNLVNNEVNKLRSERHKIEQVICVIENMIWKQDKESSDALDELYCVKDQVGYQKVELSAKNQLIDTLTSQLYHTGGKSNRAADRTSTSSEPTTFNQKALLLKSRVQELDTYVEEIKSQRDQLALRRDETDKLQRAYAMELARVSNLEKKRVELEKELASTRETIRKGDISGLVQKLEGEILRLQAEKKADEEDFERSYENALNENKKLKQTTSGQNEAIKKFQAEIDRLNNQLDELTNGYIEKGEELLNLQTQLESNNNNHENQRQLNSSSLKKKFSIDSNKGSIRHSITSEIQPVDKDALQKWAEEKMNDPSGRADIIEKLIQVSKENAKLSHWLGDLENQSSAQRYQSARECKSLEHDVINLTMANTQLSKDLDQITAHHRSNNIEAVNIQPSPSSSSAGKEAISPLLDDQSLYRKESHSSIVSSVSYYTHESQVLKNHPSFNNSSIRSNTSARSSSRSPVSNKNNGAGPYVAHPLSPTMTSPPLSDPPSNPLPPVPHQQVVNIATSVDDYSYRNGRNYNRDSIQSNSSIVSSVEHYEQLIHNQKLRINAVENNVKVHQDVIHKLENQLNVSESRIQEQKTEIDQLLTLKEQMDQTGQELKQERILKQKAEKAQRIMENRMQELMNKKSKFLCF